MVDLDSLSTWLLLAEIRGLIPYLHQATARLKHFLGVKVPWKHVTSCLSGFISQISEPALPFVM